MKENIIPIMENSYLNFAKNKNKGKFVIRDRIKDKTIMSTADYHDAMRVFMDKSREYSEAAIDDTCTCRGISLEDLMKGLEVLPKSAVVDFSICYDAAENKLKLC
ncbi:MAG: hypothetical protein GXO91_02330 [FCB group bacterium]|nr:hypothetical protein [FCB group bacterium]